MVEKIVSPDGVGVSVEMSGAEDAPRIIFIHGVLQSRLCWKLQMNDPRFSGYRRVAYDLRGHGASDKPDIAELYQGSEVWAQELAAVIENSGTQPPILVGWSFGGKIMLDYISQYGADGLAGMVMVDAPSRTGPGNRNEVSARLLGEAMSDDLKTMVAGRIAFFDMCFVRQPDAQTYKECLATNFLMPTSVLRALGGKPVQHDDTLKAFHLPAMVVQGDEDELITKDKGKLHAELISGARYVEYAGVGHSPFLEVPDDFNADLFEFVERVRSSIAGN